ncbi:SDR family oxidoreductase [Acidisoma cellulosilytica]|uniref:SDR family oxidoreductase n=2 Tax=Acidisoma cellulosilyticum TaxID=2802395 RepID=A0A963Z4A9_9PROT|nr:SDR family oxidoreductase [Acidisoma cellulosilyticum]
MDLGLRDKIVLVTGGSKGIGLACAAAFLSEGAKVAIVSRSADNIARAKLELGNVLGLVADLADPLQAAHIVETVERDLGAIDVLVNSAGAAKRTPPDDLTPDVWHAAMSAKYFTYIYVIDPMIKLMARRNAGVIVNVIGNGGKVASPVHLPGGSANAALMLATAGLATAYAPRGVRVVGVNPGLTETSRVAEGFAVDARLSGISVEETSARALAKIPIGRMAEPKEIADVVVFLASARASYVSGVNIAMDGVANAVI